MGEVRVSFCDHCGLHAGVLNKYMQVTEFQLRTTEWDKGRNTLELCDVCFEKSKKDFESLRKYTAPRKESDAGTDAEKKKKKPV